MVKSNLMARINKVHRPVKNRFDISSRRLFTTAPGMLKPVYYRELCPGNHISLDLSAFSRTVPMRKAAFCRIDENYDVFFVPFRLLCEGIQDMLAGTPSSRSTTANVPTTVPIVHMSHFDSFITYLSQNNIKDDAGIAADVTSKRLIFDLGLGFNGIYDSSGKYTEDKDNTFQMQSSSNSHQNVFGNASSPSSLGISALPLAAYQKIYQDYYRNKYWENENTESYLLSNSTSRPFEALTALKNGLLSQRYSNISPDRVFGMMPDEGGIFSEGINFLNISSKSSFIDTLGSDTVPDADRSIKLDSLLQKLVESGSTISYSALKTAFGDSSLTPDEYNPALNGVFNQLNALSMKRMEAVQRFAEICALNKDDYKHQMQAHFGVDVPDLNSDYCQYLGGMTNPINISEVEQTTPGSSSSDALGELGARGVCYGKGGHVDYTANEHGYLMVIHHLQPQIDSLANFIDPQLRRYDRYDFMQPEFDDLGFEPVRLCDIYNTSAKDNSENKYFNPMSTVGWLPRYWSYKTDIDRCSNGFQSTSVNGWNNYVIKFNFNDYLKRTSQTASNKLVPSIDYRFFKVIPSFVDPLFYVNNDGTSDTDEFVHSLMVNAIVDLPLSVDGLPY